MLVPFVGSHAHATRQRNRLYWAALALCQGGQQLHFHHCQPDHMALWRQQQRPVGVQLPDGRFCPFRPGIATGRGCSRSAVLAQPLQAGQQTPQQQHQFIQINRFGQVGIGTGLQAGQAVFTLCARRQKHDAQLRIVPA